MTKLHFVVVHRGYKWLLRHFGDLARKIAVVMAGTAGAHLIVLVAQPIIARVFEPQDLGYYTALIALVNTINSINSMHYEYGIVTTAREDDARLLFGLAFGLIAASCCILAVAAVSLRDWIASALGISPASRFMILTPVAALTFSLNQLLIQVATRFRLYRPIANSRLFQAASLVLLQSALGLCGFGVFGLIAGFIASTCCGIAVLLFQAPLRLLWDGQLPRMARLVEIGKKYRTLPLLSAPATFIERLLLDAPVMMVSALFGPVATAHYGLAYRALAVPNILVTSVLGQVYSSEGAKIVRDRLGPVRPVTIRILTAGTLLAVVQLLAIGFLDSSVFGFVFGEKWRDAGHYVVPLTPLILAVCVASPLDWALWLVNRLDLALYRGIARAVVFLPSVLICLSGLAMQPKEAVAYVAWGLAAGYAVHLFFSLSAVRFYDRSMSLNRDST